MIRVLAVPIILFSMFVTIPQVEATCTTAKIGNQSFTNCSNGVSGFSVQSGENSFHQFSDGSTSVTNSFGNTSFSNSNQPNLRGTSQSTRNRTWVHRSKICCLAPRRSPKPRHLTLPSLFYSVKALDGWVRRYNTRQSNSRTCCHQ